MSFLCNNIAVVFIAVVVSALAWVFGGTRSDYLVQMVPWLMLFMIEIMFFFPQKRHSETTYEARNRAWSKMKSDPLVWTALGLIVLLAIPFANNGLCPICDSAKIAQGMAPGPFVKFLPFCVNRMHHLNVFLWFVIALSAMVVTKHCLNTHGKIKLLEMIVWNGVLLSLLGFVQAAAGAPGPLWIKLGTASAKSGDFFSTFGYPNMAGDYFTTLFALSAGLWRWRYEEVREDLMNDREHAEAKKRGKFWRQNYMLIPVGINFFAALNTLSRASIILVTLLATVFFLHTFVTFLARMHKAKRVKSGTLSLLILGAIAFSAVIFMPDNIQKEVDTLDSTTMLDRVSGKGQYHVDVATRLWRDHVLFGCGGWGYRHLCISKMTPEELKGIQKVGGANVHNDYLQFLAEHGLVGFCAMVAMVLMLLAPIGKVWKKLVEAVRFMKPKEQPPKPVQLFVIPAPVFCILMAMLASFIHGFGDCPFRSPAILTLFYVMLAAMEGFLPQFKTEK